jgi:hypothetical protein
VLIGMGPVANAALKQSELGLFIQLKAPAAIIEPAAITLRVAS